MTTTRDGKRSVTILALTGRVIFHKRVVPENFPPSLRWPKRLSVERKCIMPCSWIKYGLALVGLALICSFSALPVLAQSEPVNLQLSGRLDVSMDNADLEEFFRKVDGLSANIEVMEYLEGGINNKMHKIIGPTRFSNIVLRRGVIDSVSLFLGYAISQAKEPEEVQRLEMLVDRIVATDAFFVMVTNFSLRDADDEDLWFPDIPAGIFLKSGTETFVLVVEIPGTGAVDFSDLPDPKSEKEFAKLLNPKKDTIERMASWQEFQNLEPGNPELLLAPTGELLLSTELLFDGRVEADNDKEHLKRIDKLLKLDSKLMRRPSATVTWGTELAFKGKLSRLGVNYAKFLSDGTRVRAPMLLQLQSLISETICSDGLDNDGDGSTDCADPDCALDPACVIPPVEMECADGADNDQDGLVDCSDPDCVEEPACAVPPNETDCADGIDNDQDGNIDCADADCGGTPSCAQSGCQKVCEILVECNTGIRDEICLNFCEDTYDAATRGCIVNAPTCDDVLNCDLQF